MLYSRQQTGSDWRQKRTSFAYMRATEDHPRVGARHVETIQMQKTQAPTERSSTIAAGRAGRQARRRGAVWLVPGPSRADTAPFADQLPQVLGTLALAEETKFAGPTEAPAPACVLIVEDDPHVAGLLRRALELEGHTDWSIDILSDGHAALTRAQQAAPNIVLLDVRLPDMDGAEVYRRLRASPATQECQVVFLTASTSLDLSLRGVDGGVLLRKPFDVEQVITLVSALLQES